MTNCTLLDSYQIHACTMYMYMYVYTCVCARIYMYICWKLLYIYSYYIAIGTEDLFPEVHVPILAIVLLLNHKYIVGGKLNIK